MARGARQLGLRVGAVLAGKLRVERVIGRGAMGIVVEATDILTERRVAVKLMSPAHATDPDQRARFAREARAAARLSSQHATRVLEIGELEDETPFFVMEY